MERLCFSFIALSMVTVLHFALAEDHNSNSPDTSVACQGFVPDNDQYYPVPEPDALGRYAQTSGLTKQQFDAVIDRAVNAYEPLLKAQGVRLEMNRLWNNGLVNASAQQRSRQVYTVNMYGGLARHPVMTEDGFLMVVCHELGHHLAGAPTYGGANSWASAEGQADYYASNKCFRELFTEEEHLDWYRRASFDETAFRACNSIYSDSVELAACLRASEAGLVLARLFNDLRRSAQPLSFDTASEEIVRRTQVSHPQPQCRLDTYFHGALCFFYSDLPFDSENPFTGACNEYQGFEVGVRPACWFNAQQYKQYLPGSGADHRPWWWWLAWWRYS